MTQLKLTSVSAVFVLHDSPPSLDMIEQLGDHLASAFHDSEIIIIANAVSGKVAFALKPLIEQIPDISIHFLAHPVDSSSALLLGMENSISDYVLLLTPTQEELDSLEVLFLAVQEEFDMIIAEHVCDDDRRLTLYSVLERAFFRFYNFLNHTDLEPDPSRLRLLSRPAVQHI